MCFGQFLCPSSGVFHCTHSNGICHTGLLTACEQDQDWVPSWSCSQTVSKPVWHISMLCVEWKTHDDGQRNCPKHVDLIGFIIRIYHDARSSERQIRGVMYYHIKYWSVLHLLLFCIYIYIFIVLCNKLEVLIFAMLQWVTFIINMLCWNCKYRSQTWPCFLCTLYTSFISYTLFCLSCMYQHFITPTLNFSRCRYHYPRVKA